MSHWDFEIWRNCLIFFCSFHIRNVPTIMQSDIGETLQESKYMQLDLFLEEKLN